MFLGFYLALFLLYDTIVLSRSYDSIIRLNSQAIQFCCQETSSNDLPAFIKCKGDDSMRFIITGRNFELTPSLQKTAEDKLKKLERYFNADTEAQVTLSVEKDRQKIEVTIPVKGHIIRAEQVSNNMYTSIDLVQETIERQLKKYKTKLTDKYQTGGDFSDEFLDESLEDEDAIKIVRTKRFAIKPMDAEEACLQMEMLNHNFYVFRNAETDQVNVVYKRKSDTYGLIEPEF